MCEECDYELQAPHHYFQFLQRNLLPMGSELAPISVATEDSINIQNHVVMKVNNNLVFLTTPMIFFLGKDNPSCS